MQINHCHFIISTLQSGTKLNARMKLFRSKKFSNPKNRLVMKSWNEFHRMKFSRNCSQVFLVFVSCVLFRRNLSKRIDLWQFCSLNIPRVHRKKKFLGKNIRTYIDGDANDKSDRNTNTRVITLYNFYEIFLLERKRLRGFLCYTNLSNSLRVCKHYRTVCEFCKFCEFVYRTLD